jgi:hypothetical protein
VASLYITEYAQISPQGAARGSAQVGQEQPLAEQKISIAASSTASASFSPYTRLVRLHADAVCSILFGSSAVTATASSQRLNAGVTEYHGIPDKQVVTKVACITNS